MDAFPVPRRARIAYPLRCQRSGIENGSIREKIPPKEFSRLVSNKNIFFLRFFLTYLIFNVTKIIFLLILLISKKLYVLRFITII